MMEMIDSYLKIYDDGETIELGNPIKWDLPCMFTPTTKKEVKTAAAFCTPELNLPLLSVFPI